MSAKGNNLLQGPKPPYYAVIFTNKLSGKEEEAYHNMAAEMLELAKDQEGFIGYESARDMTGITVSYWKNPEAIQQWKRHTEHSKAQQKGKAVWYAAYSIRICKVEREYSFCSEPEAARQLFQP